MLWTILVILLVLWALGLISGYTFGGVVHVLLVIALVVLVIQLVQGKRVVGAGARGPGCARASASARAEPVTKEKRRYNKRQGAGPRARPVTERGV
jgi:uncharacterized protein (DUF58 family)